MAGKDHALCFFAPHQLTLGSEWAREGAPAPPPCKHAGQAVHAQGSGEGRAGKRFFARRAKAIKVRTGAAGPEEP